MNNSNTLFGQILGLVPRSEFDKLVKQYKIEKSAKGFSSWSHFCTMLFAQFSGQSGLRSMEDGMNKQGKSLYHLGIPKFVKRSTISYANKNRNSILFEQLFYKILELIQVQKPKHGFRFKNPLYSIDATTIDLCFKLFPWADFRKEKAGIKLSVKLDHRGKIPCFVVMSNAKHHELTSVSQIPLESGDIVAFDRGYTRYSWFANLCSERIYFVTRMKSNATYTVVKTNSVGNSKTLLSDEVIELKGFYAQKDCPYLLRKIVSKDPITKKQITILTNHLDWAASTISSIYKDRWQIELFFKAIKQNLKIKRFYGTSRNAVMTQVWISLISYLLFKILKFKTKAARTFTCFISVLPTVLFQRRSLFDWFSESPPPISTPLSGSLQLEFL
jgi:hypothetical protein